MPDDKTQDDAIQKDVLDGDDEVKDPRMEAVDSIVARQDVDRKVEMGMEPEAELDPEAVKEPDPKLEKEPEKEPEPAKAAEPAKEPDPDPAKAAEPAKPAEPEEMVKIVVHGKESEVPKSKAVEEGIRALQKESAADHYLEETKKLFKEFKELKESLAKPVEEPKKDTPPKEDVSDTRTDAELLEAIRYGEAEEAEAAIKAIRQRSNETSVTPEAIEKMVDARLVQKSAETIWDSFQKSPEEGGYSDIVADEDALEMAKLRVNQLAKNDKRLLKDWKTYQEAGDWARKTVLGIEPTPIEEEKDPDDPTKKIEKNLTSSLDNKIDKKRKLTVISPASKTIEAKSKEEELTEDQARAKAIQDIRKQREGGR